MMVSKNVRCLFVFVSLFFAYLEINCAENERNNWSVSIWEKMHIKYRSIDYLTGIEIDLSKIMEDEEGWDVRVFLERRLDRKIKAEFFAYDSHSKNSFRRKYGCLINDDDLKDWYLVIERYKKENRKDYQRKEIALQHICKSGKNGMAPHK